MSNKLNEAIEIQDEYQLPEEELHRVRFAVQTFDVDRLVRLLQNKDLVIPSFRMSEDEIDLHGFQREFVWKKPQMDSFVESVLMKYPTQGIFLVEQSDDSHLVLDGQQRLTCLKYFKEGTYKAVDENGNIQEKRFILESKNVSSEFAELTYDTLPDRLRRAFDGYVFSATVIRTIPESGNKRAIYQIFERINSKGTLLNDHEIRIATYAGPIITFVEKLNASPEWREFYGKQDQRLKDHELITRILALYFMSHTYKSPMKSFMNEFYEVYGNRVSDIKSTDDDSNELVKARKKFLAVAKKINSSTFTSSPYGLKNLAWIDSTFVGLMELDSNELENLDMNNLYEELLKLASHVTKYDANQNVAEGNFRDEYSRHAAAKSSVEKRLANIRTILNELK